MGSETVYVAVSSPRLCERRTLRLLLLYIVSTLDIVFSIPLVDFVIRLPVFGDVCEHGHVRSGRYWNLFSLHSLYSEPLNSN